MTSLHTPEAALEAARNHYAAALAAHDHLIELYDNAAESYDKPNPSRVAAAHDAIRFGLKAGELAAAIALAADLIETTTAAESIRARLVASAPTTSSRVRTLSGDRV